jgi:hypothetical protein
VETHRVVRRWDSHIFLDNWLTDGGKVKVKLSLYQAVETHRVVRRWGSHIYRKIDSQMAVRLSALRAGRPLPPGRFVVLISVRGLVDPRAIVRLEGFGRSQSIKDNKEGNTNK